MRALRGRVSFVYVDVILIVPFGCSWPNEVVVEAFGSNRTAAGGVQDRAAGEPAAPWNSDGASKGRRLHVQAAASAGLRRVFAHASALSGRCIGKRPQ